MSKTKTYLETLLLYYEEEVEGEAYFMELAKAFDDPTIRRKVELLGEVERHAAQAVFPLLQQYGLAPKSVPALIESGKADAQATEVDWPKLLAGMNKTYPGYLNDFQRLEAMAPQEDLQRLNFLTEHEVAAIEFLRLEGENSEKSVTPLEAYLATDPKDWVVAAAE